MRYYIVRGTYSQRYRGRARFCPNWLAVVGVNRKLKKNKTKQNKKPFHVHKGNNISLQL